MNLKVFFTKKFKKLASTYVIISEPLQSKTFWYKDSLIWETAHPYLYLRTTNDNRIVVGGKDVNFYNPTKRDSLIQSKALSLLKSFKRLFPDIFFKIDFAWAGTFSETRDGLPYIGNIPQQPNTYYALGYGGNGETFSLIAAQIIRDKLLNKRNELTAVFAFNR